MRGLVGNRSAQPQPEESPGRCTADGPVSVCQMLRHSG